MEKHEMPALNFHLKKSELSTTIGITA